jgi:CheY-like chemotaxis protein
MDLRMKRVDGIEATSRLAASDGPPVLALTTFNDDELLSGALRAGAAGFVLKDSSAEELIRAVRAVATGDSYLDPAVTARVLTTYRKAAEPPRNTAIGDLTARELDVLTLMRRACPTPKLLTPLASRASPSRATLAASSPSSTFATAPPRSCTHTTAASLRHANAVQSLNISRAIAASSMNASRCAIEGGGFGRG